MSVVDVSLSEGDSGFEAEGGVGGKDKVDRKRSSKFGDGGVVVVVATPGSGAPGDPLLTLETARRWLEDSAYDVRITAVIMFTRVSLVGFYAVEGSGSFAKFAAAFFFFGKVDWLIHCCIHPFCSVSLVGIYASFSLSASIYQKVWFCIIFLHS
jgi:hypothetical protein